MCLNGYLPAGCSLTGMLACSNCAFTCWHTLAYASFNDLSYLNWDVHLENINHRLALNGSVSTVCKLERCKLKRHPNPQDPYPASHLSLPGPVSHGPQKDSGLSTGWGYRHTSQVLCELMHHRVLSAVADRKHNFRLVWPRKCSTAMT